MHTLGCHSSWTEDFRNPDDPDDKSFEVESVPTADLEYPNNFANEKCVFHRLFTSHGVHLFHAIQIYVIGTQG